VHLYRLFVAGYARRVCLVLCRQLLTQAARACARYCRRSMLRGLLVIEYARRGKKLLCAGDSYLNLSSSQRVFRGNVQKSRCQRKVAKRVECTMPSLVVLFIQCGHSWAFWCGAEGGTMKQLAS